MERLTVALTLALLGLAATTGLSEAASDRTEVMVGTGITVLVLMALITVAYGVKHFLGLDRMPAPPPNDHAGGHH